jgi:hypothetical protein
LVSYIFLIQYAIILIVVIISHTLIFFACATKLGNIVLVIDIAVFVIIVALFVDIEFLVLLLLPAFKQMGLIVMVIDCDLIN